MNSKLCCELRQACSSEKCSAEKCGAEKCRQARATLDQFRKQDVLK